MANTSHNVISSDENVHNVMLSLSATV